MPWIISVLLWVTTATAATTGVEAIKSPRADPKGCWPNGNLSLLPSWVCDPDGYINNDTMYKLNDQINYIYLNLKTECEGTKYGDEIGVLIISQMTFTSFFESKSSAAERYAKAIHDSWGVGSKTCNNGAVVFMSVVDRQIYISTGAGIKDRLTTSALKNVIDVMKGYCKRQDYNRALLEGTEKIIAYLDPTSSTNWWAAFWRWIVMGVITVAIFCALILSCDYLRSWYQRRNYEEPNVARLKQYSQEAEKLARLKQDLKKKKKIEATMCPICLGDFEEDHTRTETDEEEGQALTTTPEKEILCCGHQYHQNCISAWLQRKNHCPVCRQENPREPPPTTQTQSDDIKKDEDPRLRNQADRYSVQSAYLDLAFYDFAYSHHRHRYADVSAWNSSFGWNWGSWSSSSTATYHSASASRSWSSSSGGGSSSWSFGGSFGGGSSLGGGGFGGSW